METYQKGEYIRYGINGVCLVEDIREDAVSKREAPRRFYVLRPVADPGSTILVPTDSRPLLEKISRLPGRAELDGMIQSARSATVEWIDDRQARAAVFQALVKDCDLRELICLVGCIYRKRQELAAAGKKLSSSDENILRRAEGLIENELAFVLEIEKDQVGAYIREKLEIDRQ